MDVQMCGYGDVQMKKPENVQMCQWEEHDTNLKNLHIRTFAYLHIKKGYATVPSLSFSAFSAN